MFATHGIPLQAISDNGTQYTSQEFQDFAKDYGFTHTTISAKHSQSNGLAEKTVGIAKNMLKKCKESGHDLQLALLEYRNTPVDKIDAPSVLLMGRELRSILPAHNSHLKPRPVLLADAKKKLESKQTQQRKYYNRGSKALSKLKVGEPVMIQLSNQKWKPAIVTQVCSDRSYVIRTEDGAEYKRNRVHLKQRNY